MGPHMYAQTHPENVRSIRNVFYYYRSRRTTSLWDWLRRTEGVFTGRMNFSKTTVLAKFVLDS